MIFLFSSNLQATTLTTSPHTSYDLVAAIFGGLGIFLVGIKSTATHLHQMTGGIFKAVIAKISNSKLGIFIWGILLGFFTQSGRANSLILAGFVQADILRKHQCLPIICWGNLGSMLIVFLSMLPINTFALLLLGLTALGLTFRIPKRFVNGYGMLFGVGMIMYGLSLIKSGSSGFAAYDAITPFLVYIHSAYLFSFLLGMVAGLLIQSNIAVTFLSIVMTSSGFFQLEEAIMIIYGTRACTGLLTYLFAFHFQGKAKQVVVVQVLFELFASLLFVLLFYVEIWTQWPLVVAMLKNISTEANTQAMYLALFLPFVGTLFFLAFSKYVWLFIEKYFPPSASEALSMPEFLSDYVTDSPETGLILIEKEQFRLLQRLPFYMAYLREGTANEHKISPQTYHAAFLDISNKITNTMSTILAVTLSAREADYLIKITKTQEQLVNLESLIFQLSESLEKQAKNSKTFLLGKNIMESIDLLVLTAIDAVASKDEMDIDMLKMLTQDRGDMMTKVRRNSFSSEHELSPLERNFILDITIIFENAVLTLRRYAELLNVAKI